MKLFWLAPIILCVSSWAQIAAVGTPVKANNTGSNTGAGLAYTPVNNADTVYLAIILPTSVTITSCTDGTTLLSIVNFVTYNSKNLILSVLNATNTSHTAYSCSWTGGAVAWAAVLQEFSPGNNTLTIPCSGSPCGGAGSSGTATLSPGATSVETGDWLVCAFGDNGNTLTVSGSTNNLIQATTGSNRLTMGYVQAASGSQSMNCTATLTSSTWGVVAALQENFTSPGITQIPNSTFFNGTIF